jgi:hypothetical protein
VPVGYSFVEGAKLRFARHRHAEIAAVGD